MAWGLPCCEDAATTSVLAVFQAQKRCGALAASHLDDPAPLQRLHGPATDIPVSQTKPLGQAAPQLRPTTGGVLAKNGRGE